MDNFIQTTALTIILNLCQLQDTEIKSIIDQSLFIEQRLLLSSLCNELNILFQNFTETLEQYNTPSNTTSSSLLPNIKTMVQQLDDKLTFINNLLWCSLRTLNVRLCEYIMHQFVYKTLLQHLIHYSDDSDAGNVSNETKNDNASANTENDGRYGEKEEKVAKEDDKSTNDNRRYYPHISLFFLSKIFMTIDYLPLIKMVAVVLLHPYSPLTNQLEELERHGNEYIMTPALNAIAQNDFVVVSSSAINDDTSNVCSNAVMEESTTFVIDSDSNSEGTDEESEISIAVSSNIYRSSILHHLSGLSGSHGIISAAALLESIIEANSIDFNMLKILEIVPCIPKHELELSSKSSNDEGDNEDNEDNKSHAIQPSVIEDLIGNFFATIPNSWSTERSLSLDIIISLSTCFVGTLFKSFAGISMICKSFNELLSSSSLLKGIIAGKRNAIEECYRLQKCPNLSLMLPDLIEMELSSMYQDSIIADYVNIQHCNLRNVSSSYLMNQPELYLLSEAESHSTIDEVKDARFVIRKFFLLNLLNEVIQETANGLSKEFESSHQLNVNNQSLFQVRTHCAASAAISMIGAFSKKTMVGANINFSGKNSFHFVPSLAITDIDSNEDILPMIHSLKMTENETRRHIADKILRQASPNKEMILVIDSESESIFVLKPDSKMQDCGTMLSFTNLQNILAVANDEQWLHIAMRNVEDVGVLIQKGKRVLLEHNIFSIEINECLYYRNLIFV